MATTNRAQLALLAILVTILVGWVLHVSAAILRTEGGGDRAWSPS